MRNERISQGEMSRHELCHGTVFLSCTEVYVKHLFLIDVNGADLIVFSRSAVGREGRKARWQAPVVVCTIASS